MISKVEAAYQILTEIGTPQHYTDILNLAVERGLINTRSLTPGSALISSIVQDTAKRMSRGELPRFDQMGNGVYGLTEWRPVGIERRIQEINQATREELRDLIANMPPSAFEELVGELLIGIGFDEDTVEVVGRSGDGGIDVIGVMDIEGVTRIDVAVQVKRVRNNIPPDRITSLRGSLMPHQRGIFITTSYFTKQSIQEATASGKTPISLVNIEQLLDLLFKHSIGVSSKAHTIYEIDDDYWPEIPNPTAPIVSATSQKVLGQVPINYPLPIFASYRQNTVEAILLETGQVIVNGDTHSSVSAAGIAVTGWKSCNGWRFWSFVNPSDSQSYSIDVLRNLKTGN